ncbi:uncharacterized protein MYCGRDRAFT_83802 [Zymoseptoria tritici IPO323]|uniref:Crh-like protein n=1 Tax=Zymoseptoria tritici (strain CBS 115943 / IPO323) TaxID=336722 RepID=F9X102_ZYMTI|nr:uncharacterized protein MYCGRDRAFT_83802 [Zymoseptoria tritici IPO323]EGP91300.1 hypothetical protein MYCGRDRAFT_83802 [Zymoseptoria tritici IPO323]
MRFQLFSQRAAVALATSLPLILAQTSTDCDPTKKSCPADIGLPASKYVADFTTAGANSSWTAAAYTTIEYGSDGAVFTIAKEGQAPTIETDFYIFFGRVDVTMKAASGRGIVSSIVLESDDLDEIDWEFIGGDNGKVQSNFYGKANTTTYDRVVYHDVATPQDTYHTYSIDWTSERLQFLIDGSIIRTIAYADPLAVYGKNYPQTPMRVKLGNWAGGGPGQNKGTVEWAGGDVDFSKGPFKMLVRKVEITNNNPACSYEYGDRSGSFESIKKGTAVTDATTVSRSVAPIRQTVLLSTTVTGSAYSTNSASVSALNSDVPTGSAESTTDTTSAVGSDSPAATTSSGVETSTGGASTNTILTAGSFVGVAVGFFML